MQNFLNILSPFQTSDQQLTDYNPSDAIFRHSNIQKYSKRQDISNFYASKSHYINSCTSRHKKQFSVAVTTYLKEKTYLYQQTRALIIMQRSRLWLSLLVPSSSAYPLRKSSLEKTVNAASSCPPVISR
jgi:hypothetical protein